MGSAGETGSTFHALLIGIDNYPIQPLSGCVNDIDEIQRILLDSGVGATPDTIRRLASPRPDAVHPSTIAEAPATLADIRSALAELASDRVRDVDRVFIYYSGHGKQIPFTGKENQTFQREALVPVDFLRDGDQYEWLLDFEFNAALRRIAERTRQVTVVLDCCHAAGAFRDGDDPDSAARSLDRVDPPAVPDPAGASRGSDNDAGWLGRGLAVCHVVTACLAGESAREATLNGKRHGLLTRAFVAAIDAIAPGDRPALPWTRIWSAMRAEVVGGNTRQTPRMEGNPQRLVFAGPPVQGDPGIAVTRDSADVYHLEAGAASEITTGTELAVYGPELAYFPEFGSDADRTARLGMLRVGHAALDRAEASAVEAAFALPAGARARVVKPATALVCAIEPPSPEILQALTGSALVRIAQPDEKPEFRFKQCGGRWLLIDDQHGNGDDAPVLFGLASNQLACARAVLEHYAAYSLPFRMARRAATDLPGGLELRVLDCPRDLDPANAQTAPLDDVMFERDAYRVTSGDGVCFYVRNPSPYRLDVGLLDATAEGEVVLLGEEIIEAGQFHVFWAQGNLGLRFKMTLDNGAARARDRIVAIGRTSTAYTLQHLCNAKSFAQIVSESQGAKGDGERGVDTRGRDLVVGAAAAQRWTAAQAVIEIAQRAA